MKVTFFLGAGAELFPYDMPSGPKFTLATLFQKESDELFKTKLDNFFEIFDDQHIKNKGYYIDFTLSIYYDLLQEYIDGLPHNSDSIEKYTHFFTENKKYIRFFSKSALKDRFHVDSKKSNRYTKCFNVFKELLFKKDGSHSNKKADKFLEKVVTNLKNTQAYKKYILDKYFSSIANVNTEKVLFAKIFKYYWTVYFYLVEKIYKNNKALFSDFSDKDELSYEKVYLNIKKFTELLYSEKVIKNTLYEGSYYSLINKINSDETSVLTTNYTPFVKICKNPIYLQGGFQYFEYPKQNEVRDLLKEEHITNEKIFFPFLFSTSMTKPVVDIKQIINYSQSYEKIKQSNALVVIGFSGSKDDNHIISILKSALREGNIKKIICTYLKDKERDSYKELFGDDVIQIKIEKKIEQNEQLEEIKRVFSEIEKELSVKEEQL